MPRFASPTVSENDFDISNALTSVDAGDDAFSDGSEDYQLPDTTDPQALADIVNAEEESDDEAYIAGVQKGANRKSSNLKGKTVKKGGGFQAMGLDAPLLRAITRKGFSVPTPIQRKTIPLILDQQDVVGMARTGSGKTAAFVIPMIQRLKTHSAKVGARAAVLSPSRELALQTLKVVKELGKGTDLRTVLLVGGDNLEDQFSVMSTNPDIIIATPGRFLHLKVEMGLDLSSIQYVVFDEADRLFEMGFATQLTEILHGLSQSRQTLLFSATLPKSLVEFARAGLEDPKLVRLDAESKISPDLENAFFNVKTAEKEGALLHIIQDVIKIPQQTDEQARRSVAEETPNPKKRKRTQQTGYSHDAPTAHSTIIFAATKHHVEYLANLLRLSGYAVSYVYGSLDQTARKMQVENFRSGTSNILVVTDVAARGIDIPVLANVINYDFPSQSKIFIHRVGRTARAGRKGWSYSLVRDADVPYMLDLQLFLSRRLITGRSVTSGYSFSDDIIVGGLQRDKVEACCEWVTKLLDESADLDALRVVAVKGEKLYMRTRNSASAESAKRSKEILSSPHLAELNLLFNSDANQLEIKRESMLARVSGFRPSETIFEVGRRGTGFETADLIRKVRGKLEPHRVRVRSQATSDIGVQHVSANGSLYDNGTEVNGTEENEIVNVDLDQAAVNMDSASEDELEVTFSQQQPSKRGNNRPSGGWQDSEHFMTYTPRESNLAEERGYGVHSGSNTKSKTGSGSGIFLQQAQGATMDLTQDESKGFGEASRPKGMRWDKKGKKYVARANDEDGSRGAKMVRGESGQKIAASFRSGRFDAWKKSNRIDRMPRVGELENPSSHVHSKGPGGGQGGGARYRHKSEQAPKAADKFRDDYYKRKKRVDAAKEKRVGVFKNGAGKSEVRDAEGVRKVRKLKEKKKEKNSRPTKKRRM